MEKLTENVKIIIARFLGVFGINTASDISQLTWISRADIYPKYPEETVLFPVILASANQIVEICQPVV